VLRVVLIAAVMTLAAAGTALGSEGYPPSRHPTVIKAQEHSAQPVVRREPSRTAADAAFWIILLGGCGLVAAQRRFLPWR
jgi:hypothetical protein